MMMIQQNHQASLLATNILLFVNFIFKLLLIAFLNFSPSEFLTNTDGILTFGSVAIFINDSSPSPLYIITPSAPFACAFKFLSIKVISPLFY